MTNPDSIAALFVESYNLDLATLSSAARVALPSDTAQKAMLELLDDEGAFLCFIPSDTSPEMADIAFRLYGQGLRKGALTGEQAAWTKLRALIGAKGIEKAS